MTNIITGPAPGLNPSSPTVTGPAPGLAASQPLVKARDRAHGIGGGNLRVAAVFSAHMVLQRRQPIAVFGTGTPGLSVRATLSTQDGTASIRTKDSTLSRVSAVCGVNPDGSWTIELPAIESAGICSLKIENVHDDGHDDAHGDAVVFDDVAVGEVWVASGQSNIEYILRNDAEAARAIVDSSDARLRFINIPKAGVVDDALRREERNTSWQPCSPQTSGDMSAIAYYFATELRARLDHDVPVGIVDCYVGGTSVTCWMSEATLRSSEAGRGYLSRYHAAVAGKSDEQMHREMDAWSTTFNAWNNAIERAKTANPGIGWPELNEQYGECPWPPPMTTFSQYRPTGPYQAMVSRLAPYSVKGVLWYQGEDDAAYAGLYGTLLRAMIADWRTLWHDAGLPFIIMQLPRWISKADAEATHDDRSWARLRQAQREVADTTSNVALTGAIDLGEFDNIHPVVKRPFGLRLARTAMAEIYGATDVAANGPRMAGARLDPASASLRASLNVSFSAAADLHFGHFNGDARGTNVTVEPGAPSTTPSSSTAECSGFEIFVRDDHGTTASKGGWVPASATIERGTVVLSVPEHGTVTGVRYAWRNWGPAPLFDANDLPAEPFEITDLSLSLRRPAGSVEPAGTASAPSASSTSSTSLSASTASTEMESAS